jgi:hypothetical protein
MRLLRVPAPRVSLRRLLPLVLVALFASCSITEPTTRAADARDLERNRQRWASAELRDYEYEYHLACFCVQDVTQRVRITVRGDVVAGVVRVSDGLPASSAFGPWPTVADLFTLIERELARRPQRLDVEYDATYGYPRSIILDIQLLAADDESVRSMSNLRPLP